VVLRGIACRYIALGAERQQVPPQPNRHILPHHFTPVARENKKEYKVWINNNRYIR